MRRRREGKREGGREGGRKGVYNTPIMSIAMIRSTVFN